MSRRRMIYLGLSCVFAFIFFFGWKLTARSAYETAEYTVLEEESPCEIREYPDLMIVSTSAKQEKKNRDGSFMKLFRYISGGNESRQKIAMTTPVFMSKNASTKKEKMEFVLPKQYSSDSIPQPNNEDVEVQKREAGRFAVLRFSGWLNEKTRKKAETELREWIQKKELMAIAEAEYASYDPPWTPPNFRRNEILIRIK